MKFTSLFRRTYLSTSANRRSSDFEPLGTFDSQASDNQSQTEQSIPNSPANKRVSLTKIESSKMYTRPPELPGTARAHVYNKCFQPPIELRNLGSHSNSRYAKALQDEPDDMKNCFPSSEEPEGPDNFQVYNPTSEELPPDLCPDEGLPDALLNVRLAFGARMTSAPDENGRYVAVLGDTPTRGTSLCCILMKSILCELFTCRKAITVLLCAILGLLLCTTFIALVMEETSPGFFRNFLYHHDPDLDALMKQKWPLHDLKSRAKHVNFDTVEREHILFNFEGKIGHHKKSNSSNNPKENKPLKFNGVEVDRNIINESFNEAKSVLKNTVSTNSSKADVIAWRGMAGSVFLEEIRKRFGVDELEGEVFEGSIPEDFCFPRDGKNAHDSVHESCNKTSWYRQINGHCNNVIYPRHGSLFSPIRRILHTKPYNVDINEHEHLLRDGSRGHRHQQQTHDSHLQKLDQTASLILPMWGIFLLHDTLNIADAPGQCCDEESHLPHTYSEVSEEFTFNYAIYFKNISESSVCYVNIADHKKIKNTNGTTRIKKCSTLPPPAIYPSCNASDPRSSFNLATSFIDASNIYGSSREANEKLRTKVQGKLKVEHGSHEKDLQTLGFIPQAKNNNETCFYGSPVNAKVSGLKCLLSGDTKVHENSFITALSTIFVRQHNWIAFWLHKYNNQWNDERIFQESRRILIAQFQHITYNEYLPQILGNDLINASGIHGENDVDDDGYYKLYDPEVDPSPSAAFAYASELYLYSMLGSKAKMMYKSGKREQEYWFDQGFLWYRPEMIRGRTNTIESLLKGFASLHASRPGLSFSKKLRALHLKFANKTLDIPEILFERSQALEVPKYAKYRKVCGLKELKDMKAYNHSWSREALEALLGKSYNDKHLEDVDLMTGLLAEKPLLNARVGPTMACILIDQFLRFKKGDRYWYEGDINFHHFTPEQLKSIRESTLARIICDNTEGSLDKIQKWPMLLPNVSSNPVIPCSSDKLPKLKFELWKEDDDHDSKTLDLDNKDLE